MSTTWQKHQHLQNYNSHIPSMALHFQCPLTDLDTEQVQDYLYGLQQQSKTPSRSYFKHIRLMRNSLFAQRRRTTL
jgi:hypothetical protein